MKIIPILLLSALASLHAEVKLTVGDVSDRRTTGKFFSGLEIELKLTGPELAECKGMRVTIKDAADDTGQALEVKKSGFDSGKFQAPQKPFGGFDDKKQGDEYEVKVEFANPARAAKTIKQINGSVELLLPGKDPQGVITASLAKDTGKPLAHETLKKLGAEITIAAPKGSEVSYIIKDPNAKVASVEFCTADGKPLETQGTMSSSAFGGPKNVSTTLATPPPAGAVAKIYLVTDKSVISVPIALRGLPLP